MNTIEKALAKSKALNADKVENSSNDDNTTKSENSAIVESETTNSDNLLKIDTKNLNDRGYLIDTGTRKSIKDEFRQIKRKVLNNAFGAASKTLKNGNLIMVSSSTPNEGKTFISINLALSIALEQDKTVLLIDSDVLRPSVNRELGIGEHSGLIEYLLGEVNNVSEVIYSTNVEKLKIIPAGKPHHLSNELLSSEKMQTLAEELAKRYPDRIVIFDCPPLLGVTETLVLSHLMGQALIVVEESKSKISDIQKATENLDEQLALGIVINKAIRSDGQLYGYYGYGYESK